MHDGVFRKRGLGKLVRELAERLENPEIYRDEQVVQSLTRLLDQDCQLAPVFQPENLPNDLWVRETLIEIARSAVIVHRDLARLAGRPDDPCVREQAALLASAQDDLPLTTAAPYFPTGPPSGRMVSVPRGRDQRRLLGACPV